MQRRPNDVSSEAVARERLPLCSYLLDAFRGRGSLGGVLCPMLCYWKSRGHRRRPFETWQVAANNVAKQRLLVDLTVFELTNDAGVAEAHNFFRIKTKLSEHLCRVLAQLRSATWQMDRRRIELGGGPGLADPPHAGLVEFMN